MILHALETRQLPLALAAIAGGMLAGLLLPDASALEPWITPALALLLFATFLGVPFARLGDALADRRFLAALLVLNFVVAPLVVAGLSRLVAHDEALLIGVLLVLLTPCVDYVIVFAGMAGGAHERLLAAAPLLMAGQLLLLPPLLLWLAGPSAVGAIEPRPFVEALVWVVLVPLAAAVALQVIAARGRSAARAVSIGTAATVPLMLLVLVVVVASQARRVVAAGTDVLVLVPIYAAFLVLMTMLGVFTARAAGLDAPRGRALLFSGATRNSLVVLPLALALPPALSLAPAAVVTQTLVELVGMLVLVRVVPGFIPSRRGTGAA